MECWGQAPLISSRSCPRPARHVRRHQRSIQELRRVHDGALFAHRGLFVRSSPHMTKELPWSGELAGGLKVKRESRKGGLSMWELWGVK